MTHAVDQQAQKRRERLVKFFLFGGVVALPLTIGVINLTAFLILGNKYPDDRVADDFYKKTSLHVNRNLESAKLAQALDLSAQLRYQPSLGQIQLSLAGQHSQPAALQLSLVHYTDASKDLKLVLTRAESGQYITQFTDDLRGFNDIKLQPIGAEKPWLLENISANAKQVVNLQEDYWVLSL